MTIISLKMYQTMYEVRVDGTPQNFAVVYIRIDVSDSTALCIYLIRMYVVRIYIYI